MASIDTIDIAIHGCLAVKDILQFKDGSPTIVHLCPAHHQLYVAMKKANGKNTTATNFGLEETVLDSTMSDSEFYLSENSKEIKRQFQMRRHMELRDARSVKRVYLNSKGSYRVPSSSNDMTFTINDNKGTIEFSFSIPKYLYGHNVVEHIPQIHSSRYHKHGQDLFSLDFQSFFLYERLQQFLQIFLKDLKNVYKIKGEFDLKYIELKRIDLCYNQHFKSKEDALLYLSNQKKLLTKGSRKAQSSTGEYETGLTYTTSRGSYFKIYHKGKDYTIHQLAKHLKINSENAKKHLRTNNYIDLYTKYLSREQILKNAFKIDTIEDKKTKINDSIKDEMINLSSIYKQFEIYDTKGLQNEADKILRYEITFRPNFMAYHLKTKFFRRKDKFHLEAVKTFKDVKSFQDSKTNSNSNRNIKKWELDIHKNLNNYFTRSCSINFDTSEKLNYFNNHSYSHELGYTDYDKVKGSYKISKGFYMEETILRNSDVFNLDSEFMCFLCKEFRTMINAFQIKKVENLENISSKIKKYNAAVELKIASYNKGNRFKVPRGSKKTPVQLLKDSEKSKKGLKKISPYKLVLFVQELDRGKSVEQIRETLGLSKSTFSRYKSDLAKLEIHLTSLKMPVPISAFVSYEQFYHKCLIRKYRNIYFIEKRMSKTN